MKVEVAVLGSPSLISLTVSAGVKQHFTKPNTSLQLLVSSSPPAAPSVD